MNVYSLATKGFVSIPYPPELRRKVRGAMDSWKAFCALPALEKLKLSGGDRKKDFGYMFRQNTGPRADRKELFHATLPNLSALYEQAELVKQSEATAFIGATDTLLEAVSPFISDFAKSVERTYGLNGFPNEVSTSRRLWTLRYLHYFANNASKGDVLAHAHADRGGFTLHMDEDSPGGEYLSFDGQWRPFPLTEKETIIFPSLVLQHRSKGWLKALCHRVVATAETAGKERFSMVAFIDFSDSVRWDDVHHRSQEKGPGFNYAMPHEEFARFFVTQ